MGLWKAKRRFLAACIALMLLCMPILARAELTGDAPEATDALPEAEAATIDTQELLREAIAFAAPGAVIEIDNTGGPLAIGGEGLRIPAGASIRLRAADGSQAALLRRTGGALLTVDGTLTLDGVIVDGGAVESAEAVVVVRRGGQLELLSGGVTGGRMSGGRGAGVYSEGALVMRGGSVAGNAPCGVEIAAGSFDLHGGSIAGNGSRDLHLGANVTARLHGGGTIGAGTGGVQLSSGAAFELAGEAGFAGQVRIAGMEDARIGQPVARAARAVAADEALCFISGVSGLGIAVDTNQNALVTASIFQTTADLSYNKTLRQELVLPISPAPTLGEVRVEACVLGDANLLAGASYDPQRGLVIGRGAFDNVPGGEYTLRFSLSMGGIVHSFRTPVQVLDYPAAPQGVTLTPQDGALLVRWQEGEHDGGSDVIYYTLTWGDAPGESATVYMPGERSYVIEGLENGHSYDVQVAAVTAVGSSQGTAGAAAVPRGVPARVRTLTAVEKDGAIELRFDPPQTGGEPVTAYVVRDAETGKLHAQQEPRFVLSGLENGRTYTFEVYAQNALGDGHATTVTATPQPLPPGLPLAPRSLAIAPLDGALRVSWDVPESGGEKPIARYVVSWGEGFAELDGSRRSTVIEGLTNGQQYRVTVQAVSELGAGESASAYAAPQSSASAPGKVENLSAATSHQSVTISFDAPVSDARQSGAPVTNYRVTCSNGAAQTGKASQRSYTFAGLTDGEAYTFAVEAISTAGIGEAARLTAVPRRSPFAPRNVVAEAGERQVTIRFDEPLESGGGSVDYTVRCIDSGERRGGSARSYSFGGLTPGRIYTFEVWAVSEAGQSAKVYVSAQTASSGERAETVRNVRAAEGDGQVTLQFDPPQMGGADEYIIRYGNKRLSIGQSTEYTFTGLVNGQAYLFALHAVTDGREGAPVTVAATPRSLPGKPTVRSSVQEGRVTLHMQADDSGSPLTGWRVGVLGGPSVFTEQSTVDFAGLAEGGIYVFSVEAQNAVGYGPAALESIAVREGAVGEGETEAVETDEGVTGPATTAQPGAQQPETQQPTAPQSADKAIGVGSTARSTQLYRRATTASNARIRSIGAGVVLSVLGFEGNFAQVVHEGTVGYVQADHLGVALTQPLEGKATSSEPYYTRMNTVTGRYRAGRLERGETVQLIARRGAWWELRLSDGKQYFILSRHIQVLQ